MDFLNRHSSSQPQAARTNGGGQASPQVSSDGGGDKFRKALSGSGNGEPRWLRIAFLVLLFSLTVLAIAIAVLFYFGQPKEKQYIDDEKYQAVFLTNGQVYFGKVKDINGKYVDLQNIYYLNSQQQPETTDKDKAAQPTSFSLVKLGCELHGPVDQMVINREQVSFWENLTTEGKVAKAIEQWVQQNPNGQKCGTNNAATQPNAATENKQQ